MSAPSRNLPIAFIPPLPRGIESCRLRLLCAMCLLLSACDRPAEKSAASAPSNSTQASVTTTTGSEGLLIETPPQRGGDVAYGAALYANTCTSCHGLRGQGMPHQGANLRESRFIAQASDEQLIAFLKQGRMPGDPRSLMGLLMPPRGGNAALDDTQLGDVVAFVRTLQDEAKESDPARSAIRTRGVAVTKH